MSPSVFPEFLWEYPKLTNPITINNNRPVVLNLASGFTPVGIGTEYNILRVPEGKNNANTNYNIRKIVMGVGTTSSGTSTIRVQKSSGPHTSTSGFNLSSTGSTWNSMSADLSLSGISRLTKSPRIGARSVIKEFIYVSFECKKTTPKDCLVVVVIRRLLQTNRS